MNYEKDALRCASKRNYIAWAVRNGLKRIVLSPAVLLLVTYIIGCFHLLRLIWEHDFPMLTIMARDIWFVACLLVLAILTVGLFWLIGIRYPVTAMRFHNNLVRDGFVTSAGESPKLLSVRKKGADGVQEYCFSTIIPLEQWNDEEALLESALNVNIISINKGSDNNSVVVQAVSAKHQLPELIKWSNELLSKDEFTLLLGEGLLGAVKTNIDSVPHILIGGSTGSGKTVLVRTLLLQCILKNAEVIIADFKGVDFSKAWKNACRVITDQDSFITALDDVIKTLEKRKKALQSLDCVNIVEYNAKTNGEKWQRIIVGCDEIAELLDKTGAGKEEKEKIAKIEAALSTIARQGRAFGIHLILATQRPDANILPGQIKNNLDTRICGRSDNILSQIILDCADAADLIPKDSHGRFIMYDKTVFQAYYFEPDEMDHLLEEFDIKNLEERRKANE